MYNTENTPQDRTESADRGREPQLQGNPGKSISRAHRLYTFYGGK
jgi:hypothetical protein